MQSVWDRETAHERFWKRLVRQRAESHMLDERYLQMLRHRNDLAKADQKRFGHIWAEHNTNIYKLIAKASGETWDAEDEEKTAFALQEQKKTAAIPQRGNDNLVAARKEGPCRRQHKLQRQPEESVRLVEKGKGRQGGCSEGAGKGGPEEEASQKEEED